MKKVLILINSDIGLYNFRKELIQELINNNYEINLSLPEGERVLPLVQLGCKYFRSDIDRRGVNPINDIRLLFHYFKLIRNIQPDIILTYTIKPNIYGGLAARFTKIPYITNITGLGTSFQSNSIIKKVLIFLYKIALRKSNCCFFQNSSNLNIFEKYKINPPSKRLIPGSGVNTEFHSAVDYPNENKIKFLFIGRIMREKGINEFIAAAEEIRKKHQNVEFHIVGDLEEDFYKNLLNELQRKSLIIYHGFQKDIRHFIKNSHCIVLPSYHEGTANVLLEAAATARPIIASNIPGCKEIVDHGRTGLLVECKNTDSLVAQIERFLKLDHNDRVMMGKRGREKIVKEYDRAIVINSYMEEIDKIFSREGN